MWNIDDSVSVTKKSLKSLTDSLFEGIQAPRL